MSENYVKPPVTKEELLYVRENGTHEEIMEKFNEWLKSLKPAVLDINDQIERISSTIEHAKFLNSQETRW